MKIKILTSLILITLFACNTSNNKNTNESTSNQEEMEEMLDKADNAKDVLTYTDALEFNDAIIGLQGKIYLEIFKLQDVKDGDDIIAMIPRLKISINQSIAVLEQMQFVGDDKGFKNAMLEQFNFYKKRMPYYFAKIADLSKQSENAKNENVLATIQEEYIELIYQIEDEEAIKDNEVARTQRLFGLENGFAITEANPFEEKLDELLNE